jgi:hypothetical protein
MIDNLNEIIEEFFNLLRIESQYYSKQLKQPILLIGEKHLYETIKQTIKKAKDL